MSETNQSPDLTALENDYEIVGEVRGPGGVRAYTATRKDAGVKRRDDESGVLISVVTNPDGDEGNALSHLAADTKLLAGMTHRRLLPVIEGRWVGTDAFAVVTQRTTDSSVEVGTSSTIGSRNPTATRSAVVNTARTCHSGPLQRCRGR